MPAVGSDYNVILNTSGLLVVASPEVPYIKEAQDVPEDNLRYYRQESFRGGMGYRSYESGTGPDYYSRRQASDYYWEMQGFLPYAEGDLRLLPNTEVGSAGINANEDGFFRAFSSYLIWFSKATGVAKSTTDGATWTQIVDLSAWTAASGSTGFAGACIITDHHGEQKLLAVSKKGYCRGVNSSLNVDVGHSLGGGDGQRCLSAEITGTYWGVAEWNNRIYIGADETVYMLAPDVEVTSATEAYATGPGKAYFGAYESLMSCSIYNTVSWADLRLCDRFMLPGTVGVDMYPSLLPQQLIVASYNASTKESFLSIHPGSTAFQIGTFGLLRIEQGQKLPDGFQIESVASFNNQIFYGGKKTEYGRTIGQLYMYPRQLITEIGVRDVEGQALSGTEDFGIKALMPGKYLYAGLPWNTQINGNYNPGVLIIDEEGVHKGHLSGAVTADGIVDGIAGFSNQIYWRLRNKGVSRTTTAYTTAGRLTTLMINPDPTINKLWVAAKIGLNQNLSGDQQLVLVSREDWQHDWGATILTMTSGANATTPYTELSGYFPNGLISEGVQLKLTFARTNTNADISLRYLEASYIPIGTQKWNWKFAVRAQRAMELLNRQYEQATAATIMSRFNSLWRSRQRLAFTDIDGTAYTVIIKGLRQVTPLLNQPDGIEALIELELQEV